MKLERNGYCSAFWNQVLCINGPSHLWKHSNSVRNISRVSNFDTRGVSHTQTISPRHYFEGRLRSYKKMLTAVFENGSIDCEKNVESPAMKV